MSRVLLDQRAREVIRTELDRNVMVLAGAGAGKTHELVERMVASVRTGTVEMDRMAAITFTRKAAGEMRGRFLLRLREELNRVEGEDARRVRRGMNLIDQCFIGTIHSFCGRLLRERPIEAGLPPDFSEIDDREEALLRRGSWERFIRARLASGDERIFALEEYGIYSEDLFSFFGWRCAEPDLPLKETHTPRPDLLEEANAVLAFVDVCALRVPSRPKKHDGMMKALRRARHLVANHGIEEPRDRAALLKLFTGKLVTQNAWGEEREFAKRVHRDTLPALQRTVIDPALRRWNESAYRLVAEFVDDAVEFYARVRREAGVVTFQDLLLCTDALLREHADVRKYFQNRYRVLLIDEFQDTDPIQARILMYLTGEDIREANWRSLRPRPGSLFLVGDDKQSIYRFRRADLDVFREVRDRIEETGGAVVQLNTSFRSLGNLCGWISGSFPAIFKRSSARHQADFAPLYEYRHPGIDPHCVRKISTPKVDGNTRATIAAADAERIGDFIAAAVRGETTLNSPEEGSALGPKAAPGDFMILTRTTLMLSTYARALEARGIPFDVVGGGRLAGVTEVRALVTLLESVYEPDNPLPFLALLRGPLVGLADDELYALRIAGGQFSFRSPPPDELEAGLRERLEAARSLMKAAEEDLQALPPGAAIDRILERSGLLAYASVHPDGRASSRAGGLLRLLSVIRGLSAAGRHWGEILDELRAMVADPAYDLEEMTLEAGREDVVRLMNLHQAKGLQARVVFLADPYDLSPYKHPPDRHVSRADDLPYISMTVSKRKGDYSSEVLAQPEGWDADVEEEKRFEEAEEVRLLYVAATRARNLLVVSCYDGSSVKGPWHSLYSHLADVPELESCVRGAVARSPETSVDWPELRATLNDRRLHAAEPSYVVSRISGGVDGEPVEVGRAEGRGRDYGTVVHQLFEDAVNRRMPPDPSYVDAFVREAGLSEEATVDALGALDRLMDSDLWQELRRADRIFTEVPLGLPGIRRGVIDLIYRLDGRWKIVDFKTDAAPTPAAVDRLRVKYDLQVRAYANCWREATGEPVEEFSVYFVHGPDAVHQLCLF